MGDKLKLSDAARIVVRPGPAIQFGVDARVAGVVDTIAPQHVGPVITALTDSRRGTTTSALIRRLIDAGLSDAAAHSLVADLKSYGILRALPAVQPSVAVIGRGPLTGALSELLRGSGCAVRRPLRGETDREFLKSLPEETPLVAVDKLAHARTLGPAVRNRRRELFVPVQLVDGRGLVGPVATHTDGPCPLCTHLHRTDVDPYWAQLLTQLPGSSPAGAPAVVAATAAQAAAVVLTVLGLDSPALGSSQPTVSVGEVIQVDPFGAPHRFQVPQHPGCPLCFEAQHLQEGLPIFRSLDRADA